jgi:ribosome-associated protein
MKIDLSAEVQYKTSRSGGKGGQNVNKVETKVEARWHVGKSALVTEEQKALLQEKLCNQINLQGYLLIICSEDRTQLGNKIIALRKLNDAVGKALVVPKKRKKSTAPPQVKEARLREKKRNSEIKANRKNIDY